MTATDSVGDNYVLPTGDQDSARLDVIHEVYGPVSARGLEAAGIRTARRVADIGCGTGTVSRLMASLMGSDGHVDAIDIAEDQLAVARATTAPADSAAIDYHLASAYEPGLPEGSYDLVFVRLVLCHLYEPERALAAMAALLAPGGRLVAVDMDMYTVRAMPQHAAYETWLGPRPDPTPGAPDYALGLRLPELFAGAGLTTTHVMADQPIFGAGPGKFLWATTWRTALPALIKHEVVDAEEGHALMDAIDAHTERPDVWVANATMFAVVGTR